MDSNQSYLLFDENGNPIGHLRGSHYILSPPGIEIVEKDSESMVQYPLPDKGDYIRAGEHGEEYIYLDFFQALLFIGWKKKENTDGVLEDILRLTNGKEEKVRKFVLKWGPIWKCYKHKSEECFANPTALSSDCLLTNSIEQFIRLAQTVEAVLKIAEKLRDDKPAPKRLWDNLATVLENPNISRHEEALSVQRLLIGAMINKYISSPCGPGVQIDYVTSNTPKLTISTGIGFYYAMWIKLAETIAGAKGLDTCDGCGRVYIRHKRKPQKGRASYCDKCGESGRASKRNYARRLREQKLNQA